MRKATPIDSLNFSFEEMKSRPYQVISTLYNLHKYLKQNGDYDNFNKTVLWLFEIIFDRFSSINCFVV